MRRRQKHCTMGTMMMLLRALLVSTSYRSRGREHFELNSIKLIDSHFPCKENIFPPRENDFLLVRLKAQLKMQRLIRMRNCIELFVHASTLYYTATSMYHFMDWLSTCLEAFRSKTLSQSK